MSEYFIKGTIAIEIRIAGDSKIKLTPIEGFLSPGEKRKATAFPVAVGEKALLKKLNNKTVEFDVSESIALSLTTTAVQKKPVEIRLNEDWKIVSFILPAA